MHPKSTNYEDFIKELKASLDTHMLPDRAIHHIFSDKGEIQPYCDGTASLQHPSYSRILLLCPTS